MFCFENLWNASSKPSRLSWLLIAKSSAGWEAKKGNITFSLEPEIHFKRRFFHKNEIKTYSEKKNKQSILKPFTDLCGEGNWYKNKVL